ncbi:hypothetical protein NLA_6930 [Neisseria lactamica 020-06]|uniref:Uncharacterized protein n=4 Tax=Neisseriaceae TaxID=481 RepID=E4ZC50_NEIL0|nr:hypothetical protein NLA_6930 [Neisseria lactamica 020-06]
MRQGLRRRIRARAIPPNPRFFGTICFFRANLLIMAGMKKYLALIPIAAALSGCGTVYVPTLTEIPVRPINTVPAEASVKGFRLAPSHWTDVSKIRDEATRLSYQVDIGKMTKVQAAQYLNNFRKRLVGRNAVDDSMYEIYLRSAVDSQRGAINTEQSKLYIENALRGWQQRWKNMDVKPDNPAFTNFLMEVMKMQPLK